MFSPKPLENWYLHTLRGKPWSVDYITSPMPQQTNNHPNSSNNPQNTQKSPKVSQNPSAETATEDSFEGRTRRRRSAVTS